MKTIKINLRRGYRKDNEDFQRHSRLSSSLHTQSHLANMHKIKMDGANSRARINVKWAIGKVRIAQMRKDAAKEAAGRKEVSKAWKVYKDTRTEYMKASREAARKEARLDRHMKKHGYWSTDHKNVRGGERTATVIGSPKPPPPRPRPPSTPATVRPTPVPTPATKRGFLGGIAGGIKKGFNGLAKSLRGK